MCSAAATRASIWQAAMPPTNEVGPSPTRRDAGMNRGGWHPRRLGWRCIGVRAQRCEESRRERPRLPGGRRLWSRRAPRLAAMTPLLNVCGWSARYRARTLYLAVRPSVARVSLLGVEWECAHHVCAAAEWTRTHVYVHRSEFSQRSTPDTTSPHCILLTYRSYRLPIPIRIDSALETSHTRTSQITFVSVRCNRNC